MTSRLAPLRKAAGFVLAGGRSSRMGRDKALVEFKGQPLIAHAVGQLRDAGLSPAIAGARSDLGHFAPVIPDPQFDMGPLSGICAGLQSCSAELAVFLPVDLPLLPSGLIRYLVWAAEITGRAVTLTAVSGFPQTFPVVLRSEIASSLEAELAAGRGGCFAAFQAIAKGRGEPIHVLGVEGLEQAGAVSHAGGESPYRWFLNVNRPNDLGRIESGRVI